MTTPAAHPSGTIDLGRSLSFVTEDAEWVKKILIGSLFILACALLIGVPFVLGYGARVFRQTASGRPVPLPAWDDLGGLFEEGLRLVGVYFVYVGAVALVVLSLVFVLGLTAFGLGAAAEAARGGGDVLAALGGLGVLFLYVLLILLGLALAIYLPAALARAAWRKRFAEGFAAREILGFIGSNAGNYALVLVIYLVASFLAQFGVLLCCVGILPATFWSYLVLAFGLGETVRLNPSSV
jgi:hypothetical protein